MDGVEKEEMPEMLRRARESKRGELSREKCCTRESREGDRNLIFLLLLNK